VRKLLAELACAPYEGEARSAASTSRIAPARSPFVGGDGGKSIVCGKRERWVELIVSAEIKRARQLISAESSCPA